MNEQMKNFYDQVGLDFENFQRVTVTKGDMEKFAELIVKECGNWFNSRLVVEPDYGMEHRIERNRAVVGVMKEFNQHFGVEL